MRAPSAMETSAVLRCPVFTVGFLMSASTALAPDMPARAPGLWGLNELVTNAFTAKAMLAFVETGRE
jgi:hypothetical protein